MPATTSNDLLGTLIPEWQTLLQGWARKLQPGRMRCGIGIQSMRASSPWLASWASSGGRTSGRLTQALDRKFSTLTQYEAARRDSSLPNSENQWQLP
jgi:hypothetical protein